MGPRDCPIDTIPSASLEVTCVLVSPSPSPNAAMAARMMRPLMARNAE